MGIWLDDLRSFVPYADGEPISGGQRVKIVDFHGMDTVYVPETGILTVTGTSGSFNYTVGPTTDEVAEFVHFTVATAGVYEISAFLQIYDNLGGDGSVTMFINAPFVGDAFAPVDSEVYLTITLGDPTNPSAIMPGGVTMWGLLPGDVKIRIETTPDTPPGINYVGGATMRRVGDLTV